MLEHWPCPNMMQCTSHWLVQTKSFSFEPNIVGQVNKVVIEKL
jgi:hypothetical protein